MRDSHGGGQIKNIPGRSINEADILLPAGYKISKVAANLSFPTAVAFDDLGELYFIEAGYCYGEIWKKPRLMRITADGSSVLIKEGEVNGPWTGMVWHNGFFYIAEGGEKDGGKILRMTKTGDLMVLADSLPSIGDHHTNGPAIKDGYIYFGQGAATNAAIVGNDNAEFGWLKRAPKFSDIPCADIVLSGYNVTTPNVLTPDSSDKSSTGAFVPFGTPTSKGQIIKGRVPCTASVLRIPLEGGKPELVAWGLRNPFGLAFSPSGGLYVTENGYDERGSRPVWGTADVLWKIDQGKWYGWPDYSSGKSIYSDEEFKSPGKPFVTNVLETVPMQPPKPVSNLGVHASANGLDFSISESFGYKGEAFIAEFGDMAPKVGKVMAPVGFKVVRVNTSTGHVEDFAVNRGKKNAPASWLKRGGLERPVSIRFSKDGSALYVVDFGILKMTEKGPIPLDNTGVIWKIEKK